jgi:hypothetical protein
MLSIHLIIRHFDVDTTLACMAYNLIITGGKMKENSKIYAEYMQYCSFSDGIGL